jgi:hypothetical protein
MISRLQQRKRERKSYGESTWFSRSDSKSIFQQGVADLRIPIGQCTVDHYFDNLLDEEARACVGMEVIELTPGRIGESVP